MLCSVLCCDSHAQHIALSEVILSLLICLARDIPRLYKETSLPKQNRWSRKSLIRADLAFFAVCLVWPRQLLSAEDRVTGGRPQKAELGISLKVMLYNLSLLLSKHALQATLHTVKVAV